MQRRMTELCPPLLPRRHGHQRDTSTSTSPLCAQPPHTGLRGGVTHGKLRGAMGKDPAMKTHTSMSVTFKGTFSLAPPPSPSPTPTPRLKTSNTTPHRKTYTTASSYPLARGTSIRSTPAAALPPIYTDENRCVDSHSLFSPSAALTRWRSSDK